jgi:hypothetical protein
MKAVEWLIDVAGPMMSSRERRQFEQQFAEALAEPESDRPETAMLQAATRWFCSIVLPEDEEELWRGPPLCQRTRLKPITSPVTPRAYR